MAGAGRHRLAATDIDHLTTDLTDFSPIELCFGHLIGHRVQGHRHCDAEFDSLAALAVRGGTGKHVQEQLRTAENFNSTQVDAKRSVPEMFSTLEKKDSFLRAYHSLESLPETFQLGLRFGQAGQYIRVQNAKVRMKGSFEATGSQTLLYSPIYDVAPAACLTATG